MAKSELVLVLHGLGNTCMIMSVLSWHLKRKGYQVLNLSYPSCTYNIETLSEQIKEKLDLELSKQKFDSVSIVGFSLGSQIARLIVNKYCDVIKFSRIVMIGPPNKGSDIARYLRKVLPTSKIWGPVFNQLCDAELPNPCNQVEVGIIAGGLGIKIGFNPFFKKDNDGLVCVDETELSGAKQHKLVFAIHGTMPLQPRIIRMTARFLSSGQF